MSKLHHKSLKSLKLVREDRDGVIYEYLPLGKYLVAARGVCGGRPTIKYRRLDARHILGFFRRGDGVQQIADGYRLPVEAVEEVIRLASTYDYEKSYGKVSHYS